ncbi:MAG: LysE family translocator [Oleispira sp.]|nr:LysE family translocator [Oleispira sp.]MBL4882168.1 LysE family translocator [Oleispira sp.]
MSTLYAMAIFALATSITPGPVNIIATSSGVNFGFLRTLPHILGATIGFTSILIMLGAGLANTLAFSPSFVTCLSYAGSAFLLYMSYKIAFATSKSDKAKSLAPPSIFEGFMCQWLNPKAWIVALSGTAVFVNGGENEVDTMLIFSIVFFIICFLSISAWAALGVSIQRFLSKPLEFRMFNITLGAAQACTVIYLLLL